MTANADEIGRRRNVAMDAIRRVHGTRSDEHGATLFVSHHLNELGDEYWLKHCGVSRPTATQILDVLVFKKHWGCDDNDEIDDQSIDTFDFTLPDDVTNYVICVEFDDNGDVDDVSMES